MKILVTGGAGFIGSHLVDRLVAQKHQVFVVDDLSCSTKKHLNPKAKFFKCDVKSPKLKEIFSKTKPEIVYHLAGQKSVSFSLQNPLADATANIWGSLKVIEEAERSKVKKFIFFSSGGAVYGNNKKPPFDEATLHNPDCPYGLAKLTVDNYLNNFYGRIRKFPFVSLRFANAYGPRQSAGGEGGVVAIFIKSLLKKEQCFINGNGKQTRDFVYVGDAVEACCKAISKGQGIYNIGTGKEISVNTLYHLIAGLLTDVKPTYRPGINGEVFRSVLKSAKAKRELGWAPKVDLITGVKRTIDYFKKEGLK